MIGSSIVMGIDQEIVVGDYQPALAVLKASA